MREKQVHTFYDTPAPFDLAARHGYYQVGGHKFINKVTALQHASRDNSPISWNFNDEVFSALDWRKKISSNLLELYRQRAQQLRDRYSYLVLCWSGGADSTAILDAFLENGIRLDELVVLWPKTSSEGRYTPNKNDTRATNMMSEWDFSIKPRLDRVRGSHPELRITIGDTLLRPWMYDDRGDHIRIAEKHNYTTVERCKVLDEIISDRMRDHANMTTILGVGPVEIVLADDWLVARFMDHPSTALSASDVTTDGWIRNVEFFYWTPDMPEIPVMQAQALADYLNLVPWDRRYFPKMQLVRSGQFELVNEGDSNLAHRIRKKAIYPRWDHETFQVDKPIDTHFRHDNFQWFYNDAHSKIFLDPWESCLRSHQTLISDRFLVKHEGKIVQYKPFFSKFYPVCRLENYEMRG